MSVGRAEAPQHPYRLMSHGPGLGRISADVSTAPLQASYCKNPLSEERRVTEPRNDVVDCPVHGERAATFVCRHLPAGEHRGFHWGIDAEYPDRLWPDAWCDACESMRNREGGWNDRSEAFAAVTLVCDRCYEEARARNWQQDDEQFTRMMDEAVSYLHARQDAMRSEFDLGSFKKYDWHQDSGQLIFTRDDRTQLVTDFQFVGGVSSRSHTWLWSWANHSILEPVKQQIRRVRTLGEEQRFLKLACARWPADEGDGWDMAAVAAYLLQAKGAYRSPSDYGSSFLVITKIISKTRNDA
jgi:hypothetical protein